MVGEVLERWMVEPLRRDDPGIVVLFLEEEFQEALREVLVLRELPDGDAVDGRRRVDAGRSAAAHQALSGFCEAYWPPLYTFVRHRGYSSADAQDLVQGFFAHLLEQNTLTRADQQKGRLRTFLLGSFQNFL